MCSLLHRLDSNQQDLSEDALTVRCSTNYAYYGAKNTLWRPRESNSSRRQACKARPQPTAAPKKCTLVVKEQYQIHDILPVYTIIDTRIRRFSRLDNKKAQHLLGFFLIYASFNYRNLSAKSPPCDILIALFAVFVVTMAATVNIWYPWLMIANAIVEIIILLFMQKTTGLQILSLPVAIVR